MFPLCEKKKIFLKKVSFTATSTFWRARASWRGPWRGGDGRKRASDWQKQTPRQTCKLRWSKEPKKWESYYFFYLLGKSSFERVSEWLALFTLMFYLKSIGWKPKILLVYQHTYIKTPMIVGFTWNLDSSFLWERKQQKCHRRKNFSCVLGHWTFTAFMSLLRRCHFL